MAVKLMQAETIMPGIMSIWLFSLILRHQTQKAA
jgi:hypothetical protein